MEAPFFSSMLQTRKPSYTLYFTKKDCKRRSVRPERKSEVREARTRYCRFRIPWKKSCASSAVRHHDERWDLRFHWKSIFKDHICLTVNKRAERATGKSCRIILRKLTFGAAHKEIPGCSLRLFLHRSLNNCTFTTLSMYVWDMETYSFHRGLITS